MDSTTKSLELQLLGFLMLGREEVVKQVRSFGPQLFSDAKIKMCVKAVMAGNQHPDEVEKYCVMNHKVNPTQLVLDALAVTVQFGDGEVPNSAMDSMGWLALDARKRMISEHVASPEFSPAHLGWFVDNLPTLEPRKIVPFADKMQARYQYLLDHIGLPLPNTFPSKIHDLDEVLRGGFRPGLYIIAGRPAMGKTALALLLAGSLSTQTGVTIHSYEMPEDQLLDRYLSIACGIDSDIILNPTPELYAHEYAVGQLSERNIDIEIIDSSLPLDEALARSEGRIPIFDYLQLVKDDSAEYFSRELEVANMSRKLKKWSNLHKKPVIVLCQLNRELERRKDKTPMLSDLRESGALEQDADVVMFPFRPCVYEPEEHDKSEACLIIAKQRAGKTGKIDLHWDGSRTLFRGVA